MLQIVYLMRLALQIYSYLILATVLLSWFTMSGSGHPSIYRVQEILAKWTDPLLAPIRQVLMPLSMRIGLDFSPLVAFFFLQFLLDMLPG